MNPPDSQREGFRCRQSISPQHPPDPGLLRLLWGWVLTVKAAGTVVLRGTAAFDPFVCACSPVCAVLFISLSLPNFIQLMVNAPVAGAGPVSGNPEFLD